MIHFKPSAFLRIRTSSLIFAPIQPQPVPTCTGVAKAYGRADHARMLAHAAKRRLASQHPGGVEDAGYWKACAPAAVAKAAAMRAEGALARLP